MDKEILLQQLLDACRQGRHGVMTLARHAEAEALKVLLEESARQYWHAADEIRSAWDAGFVEEAMIAAQEPRCETANGEDIVASWERAECEVLTYFRDAYDGELPEPLAATVRRHYEAGVDRLERLRAFRGPPA